MKTTQLTENNMKKKKIFQESLLDFIVCPLTNGKLIYDKKNNLLISNKASLAYPIKEGIPILLIEEAKKITDL